jgi:signal transduction histidine kinase
VAEIRIGVTVHYDGLVRLWDAMTQVQAELETPPSFVDDQERDGLLKRLSYLNASIERKAALVETFKSEQSVLRNSLRAFPHNSERLLARLERSEGHVLAARAVSSLQHDVLLYTMLSRRDLAERARCTMTVLGALPPSPASPSGSCVAQPLTVPADLEPAIDGALAHAATIIDRHTTVEELMRRLMTLPVSRQIDGMRELYGAAHERALREARIAWLLVFGLALMAVATSAGYVIVRMQTSAVALRDTTTKLEHALSALRNERDREMEIANLKSRFVSMTSHEFRTPLSVILSSAELVEHYGPRWPDEKRSMHLQRIQQAARGMSRMLDGVLLIGRAEAGMLELSPGPIRLDEFARTVLEEVHSSSGSTRSVDFVAEAPEDEVLMDAKLLRHVLTNLLSNAFKYSPESSTVYFRLSADASGAVFEVRDEGMGIPADEQARLFDAFHRCSNAADIPGTGLGMAVVKRSLDAHEGSILVESEVGKGTRFVVRVPFLKEAA